MSNGGLRKPGNNELAASEPWAIDLSTPNVARIYDYYLGGKDNYAPDREVALLVLRAAPDIPLAPLENREFLKRAIQVLVCEAGIDQFIDIGPGLPTQGNVHELVRRHAPDASVVYVDNDPVVLAHGRALLQSAEGIAVADGDVRKPEAILSHPELRALIDLARPVAVCMSLVLQFIPDTDDPWAYGLKDGRGKVVWALATDPEAPTAAEHSRAASQASLPRRVPHPRPVMRPVQAMADLAVLRRVRDGLRGLE